MIKLDIEHSVDSFPEFEGMENDSHAVENVLSETDPELFRLLDCISCSAFTYDKMRQTVVWEGLVSLVQAVPRIRLSVAIREEQSGSILSVTRCQDREDSHERKDSITYQLSDGIDPEKLSALIRVDITDRDGNTRTVRLRKECGVHPRSLELSYDHVYPKKESAPVTFPRSNAVLPGSEDAAAHKVSAPDPKNIVISLFRSPQAASDCDYICLYGKKHEPFPVLGVPGKGTFHLGQGLQFSSVESALCTLRLISATGGGSIALAAARYVQDSIKCTLRGEALDYEMTTNWNQDFDFRNPSEFTRYPFHYTLRITARLAHGEKVDLIVSSDPDLSEAVVMKSIPPLVIMYGCLGEKTRVTLADGSQRRISEIRIGDRVLSLDNKGVPCYARVRNVWRGMEDKMQEITTANGSTLLATRVHPFKTQEGIRIAGELNEGISLLAGNDQEWTEVLQRKEVNSPTEVYNLDLEREGDSSGLFLAENIWVGDNIMQNGGF